MLTLYYDISGPMSYLVAMGGRREYPRFFSVQVDDEVVDRHNGSTLVHRLNIPSVLNYKAQTIFYVEDGQVVYLKNRWHETEKKLPLTEEHLMQMMKSVNIKDIT